MGNPGVGFDIPSTQVASAQSSEGQMDDGLFGYAEAVLAIIVASEVLKHQQVSLLQG